MNNGLPVNKDVKLKRYLFLQKDDFLNQHIPATLPYSDENLWTLLNKYEEVILKPIFGGGGVGISKLTLRGERQYVLQSGKKQSTFNHWPKAVQALKKQFLPRKYLIQSCIQLASVKKRPFDMRVMVQRQNKEDWTITGKLAKVAGPDYIVTNVARSSGYVLSSEEALAKSNIWFRSSSAISEEIDDLSVKVVKKLTEMYPSQRIWGLDIGVDLKGKPWFIEANTRPNLSLFKKLKDNQVYDVIRTLAKKPTPSD